MYSIGEMARASGLTVSALRFYYGTAALVPEWVDPDSGYRWYGPDQRYEARLLARLRRVGMPLADIRLVLAGWSGNDTALVGKLLDAHLLRLEDGLDDARRELSTVRELLALREHPMTTDTTHNAGKADTDSTTPAAVPAALRLTLHAPALAAALDTVRFAVGSDLELPMLAGVHVDIDGGEQALRLVATDRYRLAVARLTTEVAPTATKQVIIPAALVDAMRALLTSDTEAVLTLDGDRATLEVGGSQAAGVCLDHDFPDYRRLTRLPAGRRVAVDVAALRESLAAGPVRRGPDAADVDISLLALGTDGSLSVVGDSVIGDSAAGDGGADRVAVNREFLLDALAASARDQLVLELGSPIAPLAVRLPAEEDEHTFSLLMPVRLTD
jgi:DNA-binding transcriptional MerR regulator